MLTHGVIDKESGQVKNASKPANNKNNIEQYVQNETTVESITIKELINEYKILKSNQVLR